MIEYAQTEITKDKDECSGDGSVSHDVESDTEHRDMRRTYCNDDYLARWLPNIKQKQEVYNSKSPIRNEKRNEFPQSNLPHFHHQEISYRKFDKLRKDERKKTYYEAIKCSPMKLRHSMALMNATPLHPDISTSQRRKTPDEMPEMDDKEKSVTLRPNTPRYKTKTEHKKMTMGNSNVTIVELQNNEEGELGSLRFRRNPREHYENPACHMRGTKIRTFHRGIDRDSRSLLEKYKANELLVRCQSIMIYPKVLVRHKQREESKDERKDTQDDVCDTLQPVVKPKQAWNEEKAELTSTKDSVVTTKLPQLAFSKEKVTQEYTLKSEKLEEEMDKNNEVNIFRNHVINTCNITLKQHERERKSPTTKIIIPFGEREPKYYHQNFVKVVGDSGGKMRNVEWGEDGKKFLKEEIGASIESTTVKEKLSDNNKVVLKSRCLKDTSSRLNEQLNSLYMDCKLHNNVGKDEEHKSQRMRTQYLSMNIDNSPAKKFKIPTGKHSQALFIGRENYPPKSSKVLSNKLGYNPRGITECGKGFDGMKQGDEEDQQIGRKSYGFPEEVGGKRVEFLVQNSRYFAQI